MSTDDLAKFRRRVRRAVADYMRSEGCSCCRDNERHEKAEKRLAKLLEVPMYDDWSGYDFHRFSTRRDP
jgi:hypothetical protein